jgi:hypothetical protein
LREAAVDFFFFCEVEVGDAKPTSWSKLKATKGINKYRFIRQRY